MTQCSDTDAPGSTRQRARLIFLTFALTFIISRVLVFLIMAHRIPAIYFRFGGTHIHHLNYGIFILSAVGAYLLFATASPKMLSRAAAVYGIGLALTFDEFGMWLHLGGGYWQRASFDAIVVLSSLLALASFAPPLRLWRPRDMATGLITSVAALVFYFMLVESFKFATRVQPRFQHLEQNAPQ